MGAYIVTMSLAVGEPSTALRPLRKFNLGSICRSPTSQKFEQFDGLDEQSATVRSEGAIGASIGGVVRKGGCLVLRGGSIQADQSEALIRPVFASGRHTQLVPAQTSQNFSQKVLVHVMTKAGHPTLKSKTIQIINLGRDLMPEFTNAFTSAITNFQKSPSRYVTVSGLESPDVSDLGADELQYLWGAVTCLDDVRYWTTDRQIRRLAHARRPAYSRRLAERLTELVDALREENEQPISSSSLRSFLISAFENTFCSFKVQFVHVTPVKSTKIRLGWPVLARCSNA